MSYVDPDYAVAAGTASSDAYNILVDDVKNHEERILGQAGQFVLVRRGSTQSIPNATWTAVSFTAEEVDIGGWWSSGTNVVVPAGAIPTGFTTIGVDCDFTVRFATNGTGTRQAAVYLDGVASDGVANQGSLTGDPTTVVGIDTVIAAAAGVITLCVYQSSGGALNLTGVRFRVKRVGGAA